MADFDLQGVVKLRDETQAGAKSAQAGIAGVGAAGYQ